jgi:hypothetical protein
MKTRTVLILITSYFAAARRGFFTAAASIVLTTAAMGQTWNLRTDWSNTQNPNGVWSYRAGNLVLPAQLDHEPGCWLTPQFAWARSATFSDNDRAPALYRQSTSFLCVPDPQAYQIECGDIATHTNDPYGGVGGLPSVFAWTSPITGFVSVTGAVWLGRDIGRSVDWSVKLNGTSLTSGTVYSGDPYSRATPFDFATGSGGPTALQSIAVIPGDEITFEAAQGIGSPNGDIVGVEFMVTLGPGGPTPTPAPIGPCATPVPPPACAAQVQPPINADGSSTFNGRRGVVPVKFRLTCDGTPTCDLPPATIAVARTAGGVIGEINESVYSSQADSGPNFRVLECQYHYNLNSRALGVGTYHVDIVIDNQVVGNATFELN